MSETGIDEEFAEEIATTCRTGIGDTLRSVIHFTPDGFDLLYLRSDLHGGDRDVAKERKSVFVENERLGFDTHETYRRLADEGFEPAIGEYELTIRAFSDGFVSRVIVGDHGVLLTSDSLHIADFEDVAVSLRTMLTHRFGSE
ncbi:hypothetical protein ZOD2009_19813 [Haladaptatus paucihalophilus DX253]|uniref:Uncharacterized protein n=1 Tax=Haladaptatus paucihalophilus DX253 TaxID=797209 RepID=E7QYS2_HALPU|nr:hypothetical protein [Haladaptatus paucihalophilus]EFW90338.1 hypothetical protein ZOD2009_19813 [Haladaptatus paucihalophilus DX253]SHK01582.1 hypothetical protein SAMN05444342_0287 [Haladaptatus paucihalophilus DX253]